MAVLDPVTNFAKGTLTAGIAVGALALTVGAGEGALFPQPSTDGAFNIVIYNYTDYKNPSDDPNKEIVRCTARVADVLTITRAQESTAAAAHNTAGKTYKIILAITQKMIEDINSSLYWQKNAAVLSPLTSGDDVAIDGGVVIGRSVAATYGLEVYGTDATTSVGLISRYSNDSSAPLLALVKSRGTYGTPTAVQNGDDLGDYYFGGYDGANLTVSAYIKAEATENWVSGSNTGTKAYIGVTPSGTASTIDAIEIEDDGECRFYDNIRLRDGKKIYGIDGVGSDGASIAVEAGDGAATFDGGHLYLKSGNYGAGGNDAGDVRVFVGGTLTDGWTARWSQEEFGGYFGYQQVDCETHHDYYGDSQVGVGSSWQYTFRRGRGTFAIPTILADDDILGEIVFEGYDGGGFTEGAYIRAVIDGTPSSGNIPTAIEISASGLELDCAITGASGNISMWTNDSGYIKHTEANYKANLVVDTNGTAGTDCDYTTIQAALNYLDTNNIPGQVFIKDGTYNEDIDIDEDGVTIIGESRDKVVILGDGANNTIDVDADYVTIENLTAQKSNFDNNAIDFNECSNFTLKNCDIITDRYSVAISGSYDSDASHITIDGCYIYCSTTSYGGGIHISTGIVDANVTLEYISIINNRIVCNDLRNGGGIHITAGTGTSSTTLSEIRRYTINDNFIITNASVVQNVYSISLLCTSTAACYLRNGVIDGNNLISTGGTLNSYGIHVNRLSTDTTVSRLAIGTGNIIQADANKEVVMYNVRPTFFSTGGYWIEVTPPSLGTAEGGGTLSCMYCIIGRTLYYQFSASSAITGAGTIVLGLPDSSSGPGAGYAAATRCSSGITGDVYVDDGTDNLTFDSTNAGAVVVTGFYQID